MAREFLVSDTPNNPISGVPAGFAVWDSGPSGIDHSGASDPLNNLDKVGLNSQLDYLGVSNVLSVTHTFPARTTSVPLTATTPLVAHGVTGKPLILSRLRISDIGGGVPGPWRTINSVTLTSVSYIFWGLNRGFYVQADATNIKVFEFYTANVPAVTVDFEFFILDRTFGGTLTPTNELFYADPTQVRAMGGVFDTSRRYLQESTTGTPDFELYNGRTVSGRMVDISPPTGFWRGEVSFSNDANAPSGFGFLMSDLASTPAPFDVISPTNLLTPAAPTTGVSLELSASGIKIEDQSSNTIFDTTRRMLAVTDEFTGTIVLPARSPQLVSSTSMNSVSHFSTAVNSSAAVILGWCEITAVSGGSAYVGSNAPTDFSGSLQLFQSLHYFAGETITNRYVTLQPKISGGNLVIEEQWMNIEIPGGGVATPQITVDYHIFVASLTGGF